MKKKLIIGIGAVVIVAVLAVVAILHFTNQGPETYPVFAEEPTDPEQLREDTINNIMMHVMLSSQWFCRDTVREELHELPTNELLSINALQSSEIRALLVPPLEPPTAEDVLASFRWVSSTFCEETMLYELQQLSVDELFAMRAMPLEELHELLAPSPEDLLVSEIVNTIVWSSSIRDNPFDIVPQLQELSLMELEYLLEQTATEIWQLMQQPNPREELFVNIIMARLELSSGLYICPRTDDRLTAADALPLLHGLSFEELKHIYELTTAEIWQILAPEPVTHTARLAFVGDVMKHIEQLNAARVEPGVYDFNYAFRYIAPYIRAADFAIANLETTLVHPEEFRFAGWPLFRSPRSLAEALLYAGFDYVTTGNNHSFDAGVAGVRSTIDILNDVGLGFTGTFLTPECRYVPTIVQVGEFTFGLLSVTMHTNAIDLGYYNYMMKIVYHDLVEQSMIDYEMIYAAIQRLRAEEPDFIIVLPHIGIEYYGTMNRAGGGHQWDFFDRTDTRWVNWMRTMHFFLYAGADVVMNHHPHTLLPAEFVYVTNPDGTVRRAFMAYSMANFVSAQRTQPREASAVFYIDFERVDDGTAQIVGASYVPIWVRQNDPTRAGLDFTVLPVTEHLRRVDAGEPTPDLRPQDIERMRVVHNDVTHMLSGEPIPLAYMDYEYPITRTRYKEEFPGLPLWGTLPWR